MPDLLIGTSSPYSLQFARKTITFTGGTNLGAVGAVPLFTVTGEIIVALLVPTGVTGPSAGVNSTLALGVTGATTLFIAATDPTLIDPAEFWVDTAPDPNGIAIPAALKDIAITDNIIGTVAVAAITAGAIRFDIYWMPLSSDGNLVAA